MITAPARPLTGTATATGASQSLVSHHPRLLRGARLARGKRDARQIFYQATDQHMRHIIADIIAHSAEDPRAASAVRPPRFGGFILHPLA